MKAAANTFLYALSTTFVSLLLGIFLAQIILRKEKGHRLIETLSMMPLGVSSVVLGLGYLFIIRFLPGTLFSPLLVIAAHTVIAYPFVLGTVKTYLLKVPGNLNHAAGLLGASPWRIFRTIEFPLIQPGIAAAGSFAFAISAGEMNATIMFNSAGVVTMPLVIYRYVGAYNYYGACAMGVILIVLSAAAFFGADYFSLQGRRYVSAA
jgi:thiamine transport system permease protein